MKYTEARDLEDLENEALAHFLDKSDYQAVDWLDKEDAKEYCRLYNKENNLKFALKNCLCGQHRKETK